ncbi:MAG: tripartite tricarboxylate transporter substrate binding protein [Rhodovarius sp.]|nr:tripartite tricarboxylate transporter substrate binding protein [Rhodovarius sp.]
MIARRPTLLALAAALPLAAPARLRAQAWQPSGPIRVIVPFAAGGTTDILARLYASRLSETLGVPMLVENRGGGGGSIGAEMVARAAPDGQTLLFHNSTFSATTTVLEMQGRAPHLIERDFAPITLGALVPTVILVHPSVPATNLAEWIAWARAQPRPPFYGSTGPGSAGHLTGEILKRDGGFEMEHVPFRGASLLVQEMLAGRILFGGDQLSSSLGHIRSGALRAIAVRSTRRSPLLPDVATVREQGFPNAEILGWNGYFAPAATPEPIITRLQAEIAAAARHPPIAQRMEELGAEPGGIPTAEFRDLVHAQVAALRPIVRALGITAQ